MGIDCISWNTAGLGKLKTGPGARDRVGLYLLDTVRLGKLYTGPGAKDMLTL